MERQFGSSPLQVGKIQLFQGGDVAFHLEMGGSRQLFILGEVLIDRQMVIDPSEADTALAHVALVYRLLNQSLHCSGS